MPSCRIEAAIAGRGQGPPPWRGAAERVEHEDVSGTCRITAVFLIPGGSDPAHAGPYMGDQQEGRRLLTAGYWC
jgi:hypothetical protein